MKAVARWVWATLAAASFVAGCNAIIGLDVPQLLDAGAGGTTSASSTSGTGGAPLILPVSPQAMQSLQLWLTAAKGLNCPKGTFVSWDDLGPNGTVAKPPLDGAAPPNCLGGMHSLNGKVVLFFDAQTSPNVVASTLSITLPSILVSEEYTVFVVERRWSDAKGKAALLLGTQPDDQVLCDGGVTGAFAMGYFYTDPLHPTFGAAVSCGTYSGNSTAVGTSTAEWTIDMVRFSKSTNMMDVWVDGTMIATSPPMGPFVGKVDHVSIGRGPPAMTETRFNGDIAEIVIFGTALGDCDRKLMQTDLAGRWGQPKFMPQDAGCD
jgi:hypothetical protein